MGFKFFSFFSFSMSALSGVTRKIANWLSSVNRAPVPLAIENSRLEAVCRNFNVTLSLPSRTEYMTQLPSWESADALIVFQRS